MDFTKLTEQLRKLGEGELEVIEVYSMQVGCFAFASQKLPGHDSFRPITELEEVRNSSGGRAESASDFSEKALTEIFEALKSHPNVFDLKPEKPPELVSTTMGDYKLVLSEIFHFKINLPERLQRFRSHLNSSKENVEQIGIVTNGSLFGSYGRVGKFPQMTWFGQEYRELLKKLLAKREKIHCITVPPCPVHPMIYIAFVPKTYELKERFYCLKEDLVFLARETSSIENVAEAILASISLPLQRYFHILLFARLVQLYTVEISNEFSGLTTSFKGLLTTAWINLWQRHKLWKSARASLSNIHLRLVEYGGRVSRYEQDTAEFPQIIESSSYLAGWLPYFEKMFPKTTIPTFLVSALQYFERELQLFGHKRIIIIASFVGASIGVLLTTLIAILRHR